MHNHNILEHFSLDIYIFFICFNIYFNSHYNLCDTFLFMLDYFIRFNSTL